MFYGVRRDPQSKGYYLHGPFQSSSDPETRGKSWRWPNKNKFKLSSLITEGNNSQNIRLFDADTINISKSPIVLRDQLLKAGQSNLSPQFMEVFVTGRVNMPGSVKIRREAH